LAGLIERSCVPLGAAIDGRVAIARLSQTVAGCDNLRCAPK
jgi:hypothetical protein